MKFCFITCNRAECHNFLTPFDSIYIDIFFAQEPKGAYSELTPNHADPGVEVLEVRNLLEFARQIAAGMVM